MSIDEATYIIIYLSFYAINCFGVTFLPSHLTLRLSPRKRRMDFLGGGLGERYIFHLVFEPKIISTEIICTNKNYVELQERERRKNTRKVPTKRHGKFAYEMVFAWVRLTNFRQYSDMYSHMLDSPATFVLRSFFSRAFRRCLFIWAFWIGLWILNFILYMLP